MFLGTERKFGVEVEYASRGVARGTLATLLEQRGVPCRVEGYNHTTRPHWKVTTDVSCGYEVVSPVLQGEDGFRQLKVVLDTMTELGCQVNRNTGVHVHLDASDLEAVDVANVVKRYQANEQEIDQWFPRSRRGNANNYCRALDTVVNQHALTRLEGEGGNRRAMFAADVVGTRFAKVNTLATERHGTIEFRQHAGSTDYEKVSNWVLFLQHFVEQSRKVKTASGPSAKYWAKKGSVAFAEVREQVENAGGQMKSNGNGTWNVTNARGNSLTKTNAQLFALYHSEFCRSSGVTGRPRRRWERLGFTPLKQDALTEFWMEVFGADAAQTVDTSLNAEVPAPVVEFFDNRRAQLAA